MDFPKTDRSFKKKFGKLKMRLFNKNIISNVEPWELHSLSRFFFIDVIYKNKAFPITLILCAATLVISYIRQIKKTAEYFYPAVR